jgi:putative heme-binding domain-containing protein
VLAETRDAASTEPILKIATSGSDESLQLAALAALGGFDDLRIPAGLCGALPAMGAGPRAAALSILASRTRYASIAVDRVKQKTLEPAVFGDDAVRHLLAVADAPTRAAINELWPSVSTAHGGSDFEPQIRRVIGAAQSTGGDPYHGFRLFMNNCGVCHRLFGRGAEIGPDLTPYQRTDISTLALNIVNPNAEIREGYEPFQLETKDGRTLTGFLVQRDAEAVVLRCLDGQNTSVAQKEIVEIKPAGRSLMPEGLLDSMPEGDLKDLFAYLRSSQPLPDAK